MNYIENDDVSQVTYTYVMNITISSGSLNLVFMNYQVGIKDSEYLMHENSLDYCGQDTTARLGNAVSLETHRLRYYEVTWTIVVA